MAVACCRDATTTTTHQGHPVVWKKLSLLLLVLSASLPAWSSTTSHYRVEIVVFESLDKRALQSERWPSDPGTPSLAGVLELEGAAASPAEKQDFQLLPATEHHLEGVVKSLAASGQYRPLVHLAWRQPALTRQRAVAVRIAGGWPRAGSARPSRWAVHYVDGSFVLYRSRYLHVLADLVLYHADPSAFPSKVQPPAFRDGREAIPASSPPQPRRFRLSEHRRMRSGELHYLDHPVFGLLVQITPYRAAEPAALAPPDSEPENDSDRSPGTEASEPIEGDED